MEISQWCMKRKYPKNRKPGSGRPLPRANEHKLDCVYCGGQQNLDQVLSFTVRKCRMARFSYACDHCSRSLVIYKSVLGYCRVIKNFDKRKKWQNEKANHSSIAAYNDSM